MSKREYQVLYTMSLLRRQLFTPESMQCFWGLQ
ncbi:hypothetical protein ABIA85_009499 [Bradyrhizobium sp. LA6.10]